MAARGRPASKGGVTPLRPARKCPICGQPAVSRFYPFDSKRCADIDLARWMSGGYVIPAVEEAPGSQQDDGEET